MKYSTFYAKLTPNGAGSGTVFSISVTGITAVTDGQKTYGTTPLYFAITPKSSGMATVTFKNDTTGDIIGTKTIMVRSNTLANQTYDLTASATSVNEGGTVTFSIDTSDVPVGTNIAYAITGVSVADISLGSLTGNFVVTADGSADLPITITNDALSEGTETLTLTLTGKGLSKAVTINDTSLTPTYNVGWYSNSTGTTAITNANEGSTAYLVVKTTNVANGTVLPVTLSGTGVNASDFSTGAMTGNITINNNIGYLTYTLANDLTTEGAETITATVKSGSTTVGTNTLVINDTSVSTTYAVNIYDSPVNGSIVTSNAGTEVYGRITLTNGVSGHVFSVSVTGVTAIVDGQKTWTSGNLNFNMSFTSTGTATITFRNDTLNTVIGTKTISVTKISSGNGLFTVASETGVNGNNWRGYDSFNSPYIYGVELNDTLKYNNSLVESQVCSLHIAENGDLALQYWCGNVWLFNADPVLNFKLTNMTTGETYITGNVTGGKLMINVLWWHVVPVGSQALLNRMFTAGQNIKIEFV